MAVKNAWACGMGVFLACLAACDSGDGSSKGDAAIDEGADGGHQAPGMDGATGQPDRDGSVTDPTGDGGSQEPAADGSVPQVQCQATCDDGNECTNDRCTRAGVCTHTLNAQACDEGESCHPTQGCVAGKACSSMSDDCNDDDACTVNERCSQDDVCEFAPLDRDRDGIPPKECGGADCNDDDVRVGPGRTERCNNMDDDCDGVPDNDAVCPGDQVCNAGKCACAAGTMACGQSACADLQTDARHCGQCGHSCGPAGVCQNGQCSCPAPGMMCGNSCVDTKTSFQHCGGCNQQCDLNPPEVCTDGVCGACGQQAGQACCALGGMGYCIGDIPMQDGPVCDQGSNKCVAM